MVDLAEFQTDTRAINDGTWVRVNEALYGDLEILTRGFTDAFVDANNARMSKAAADFNGDRTMIPNSKLREINASLLEDHLVVDVRNLVSAGNPVPVAEFHSMLYDPAYGKLARACWEAAGRVTTRSVAQVGAARGNLPSPSASGSNGDTSDKN